MRVTGATAAACRRGDSVGIALPCPHRFGVGPAFAVGVEEELLLADPVTLDLARGWSEALATSQFAVGRVTPELWKCAIELATPVCGGPAEAGDVLRLLRAEIGRAGATLLSTGVHPAAPFGDAEPSAGERQRAMAAQLQGLTARTPYCGMHVHVGMPDPETAIRACNGMRKWVPLLHALGANSPFWHGRDSGLASARLALIRSLPRATVPRAFRDFGDFEQCVDAVLAAGELEDYTAIWWDLRPHPRLGTLEIRAFDAQTSPDDMVALIALALCLAVHEAGHPSADHPPPEALDESSFRALRDGLDATLWFEHALVTVPELAALAVDRVDATARALGCRDELRTVLRLVRDGNGAQCQRQAHRQAGMHAVLRSLVVAGEQDGGVVVQLPQCAPAERMAG
jgi:glutamate---cysteine ligase / carboxylate-amine ligase